MFCSFHWSGQSQLPQGLRFIFSSVFWEDEEKVNMILFFCCCLCCCKNDQEGNVKPVIIIIIIIDEAFLHDQDDHFVCCFKQKLTIFHVDGVEDDHHDYPFLTNANSIWLKVTKGLSTKWSWSKMKWYIVTPLYSHWKTIQMFIRLFQLINLIPLIEYFGTSFVISH